MRTYSTEQARKKLGEIIQAAAAGEISVITYRGIPAALVKPVILPSVHRSEDTATGAEAHRR